MTSPRDRAERIVANWRVNFDHDDDRPLVNMIEAALLEAVAAELERLATSYQATDRTRIGLFDRARNLRGPHAGQRHNHFTRDLKPRGVCPACDVFWTRQETT